MPLCKSVITALCVLAVLAQSQADVDFEKDIRPILAEKCTLCHGPDEAKAGLRLTSLEEASKKLKSGGAAVVPGSPHESALVERIHTSDQDEVMPPPGKAEPLTDAEKTALQNWIEQGAGWPRHWAYEPLGDTLPSETAGDIHPVDHFVYARLSAEKIEPSPQASPATLVRRLHYDLAGLPPAPDVVSSFLKEWKVNPSSAYEDLVDQLLSSPRFGERWGRHWLDKARYADSDGYEKDNNRMNAWRYRDWVIDAINADLPFDDFTIQQLAGDLLPGADPEMVLATAFNRQTLTNTEGGTDKEQWRVAAVMDRTETLGAVWLGLTVGCARCHTHKYDEITHTEYYQLFAYFNNGDETNTQVKRSEEDWQRWEKDSAAHRAKVEEKKKQHAALVAKVSGQIGEWEKGVREILQTSNKPTSPALVNVTKATGPKGTTLESQKDGSLLAKGKPPATATYTLEGTLPAGTYSGLRLDVLADDSLPSKGPGRMKNGNFVLSDLSLKAEGRDIPFGGARADHAQPGFPPENAIDANRKEGKVGSGWAVGSKLGVDHWAEFGFGEVLTLSKPTHFKIEMAQLYGGEHTIGKFKLSVLSGTSDLIVPKALLPVFARESGARTAKEQEAVVDHFLSVHPDTRKSAQELSSLEEGLPAKPLMDVRVITQRSKDPRETFVFRRGEFKQPEGKVNPGTLAVLPEVNHRGETGDRLDLARWLVNGENPLPPRVTVNHMWGHLFGTGLVPTVNDFGVRGDRPTHPELLDWLAAEFIRLGWSRKKLIKTIVMSKTYQQESTHRPELLDRDPKNNLLARQNRFRVEAEIVRDVSLAAAGLLSDKVGGPSVFPPIPDGVTDANYNSSFKWNVSQGDDRYRRGMYTFFKRTAPHPNLMTFDCPDSNVTSVVRTRSNTPLAALVTLNNETFHEAAVGLAKRVLNQTDAKTPEEKLSFAFQVSLARSPEQAESQELLNLLQKSQAYYESQPEAAEQLIAGLPVAEGEKNPQELAAWAATLRVVLNLDELLTRG